MTFTNFILSKLCKLYKISYDRVLEVTITDNLYILIYLPMLMCKRIHGKVLDGPLHLLDCGMCVRVHVLVSQVAALSE